MGVAGFGFGVQGFGLRATSVFVRLAPSWGLFVTYHLRILQKSPQQRTENLITAWVGESFNQQDSLPEERLGDITSKNWKGKSDLAP